MDSDLRNGFSLEGFEVYPLRNEIISSTGKCHILPKAMDVLCCLATNAGEVVEREAILDQVWGRVVIGDDVLTRCISELRSALGETATNSSIIQTVPKRGYRLASRVVFLTTEAQRSPPSTSLWTEFRKRSVIRVGLAYLAIAWLVISVEETTFSYLNLPESLIRITIIAAIAGLPLALVLAWLYEITPQGIVRDNSARISTLPSKGIRRLDLLTIGAVIAGVAFFLNQQTWDSEDTDENAASSSAIIPDRLPGSIAILPFRNSGIPSDKAYFTDGLAEDLIHLLSKSKDFRVSPRAASFYYKGKDLPPAEIAEQLQVAKILSGGVRIDKDSIIVTVELLNMLAPPSEPPLISEKFAMPMKDIFELQNEIATLVVEKLSVDSNINSLVAFNDSAPTKVGLAYELFMRAREDLRQPAETGLIDNAESLLKQAISYDPDYADAHALLCDTALARYSLSYNSDNAAFENAERVCQDARNNYPENVFVNVALGRLYRNSDKYDDSRNDKLESAVYELSKAIGKRPLMVEAHIELGQTYSEMNLLSDAEQELVRALELDPGYFASYRALGNFLMDNQRYDEARDFYMRWTQLTPASPAAHNNLATAYYALNEFEQADVSWADAISHGGNRSTFTNLGLDFYYAGEFAKAADMQRKALDLTPEDHLLWGRLAESARFVEGQEEESRDAYTEAKKFALVRLENEDDWETRALLALYQAHLGDEASARATLAPVLQLNSNKGEMQYYAALVYNELGDADSTFAAINKALDNCFPARYVIEDPDFKELVTTARYEELLTKNNKELCATNKKGE